MSDKAVLAADALEAIITRGAQFGARRRDLLAAILTESLDAYALARLYVVARARLGRRLGPDPYAYCPWCMAEFDEADFTAHMEAAHAAMLNA